MDEERPDGDKFESTIDKIDRLYSQKEWDEEKASRVPPEKYAHTVVGQSLADLIDEMDQNSDQLPPADATLGPALGDKTAIRIDDVIDIAPDTPDTPELAERAGPSVLLVDTHAPMPISHDDVADEEIFDESDGLTQIIQEFENRIRGHAETVAMQRTAQIEEDYQDKLKRVRKAAAVEVRKRQELARQRYKQQFKKKELQLRAQYKKLMALANKITEQKAQLQSAKKQFEEKINAANAVYKQVEDMRKTLREHIGDLPQNAAQETRRSA